MPRVRSYRPWWFLLLTMVVGSAGVVAALVTWLVVHGREGWGGDDELGAVGLAAGLASAFTAPFGQLFVERWVSERQETQGPTGPGSGQGEDVLAGWLEVLRRAVAERRTHGPGSQLEQMVRAGVVADLRVVERVGLAAGDDRGPRLRVRGRVTGLGKVTSQWDAGRSRLVILGDPGYGKTFAALTLVAYVNGSAAADDGGGRGRVAELFALAEWYRWHLDHPAGSFQEWLVYQLVAGYRDLGAAVGAALIERGWVVPVLDGLDEVPASHRRACKEAIDAYSGRVAPFRSFALTCRAVEYRELAPEWVGADQQVGLVGLEADQVASMIEQRTAGRAGWGTVLERLGRGDPVLQGLFRSPLRLAVALQAYGDEGPGELVGLDLAAAQRCLWERLLDHPSGSFGGADPAQVRSWLGFLAAGMVREARPRFWLHELYLYPPDRARQIRRFKWSVTGAVAVVGGFTIGVSNLLADGPYGGRAYFGVGAVRCLIFGLAYATGIGLLGGHEIVRLVGDVEHPTVPQPRIPLPERLRSIPRSPRLARGIASGALTGLLAALAALANSGIYVLGDHSPARLPAHIAAAALLVLIGGLAGALMTGASEAVAGQRTVVIEEPPHHLGALTPWALLTASRHDGLVDALICGLVGALLVGPTGATDAWLRYGHHFVDYGLIDGVVIGFTAGAIYGMSTAGSTWLYYNWLRLHLARHNLLPRRLPEFLRWATHPSRGWLRTTDTYEFRHRELLDHLAARQP